MAIAIDRDRLVDWASKAISIPSFTGSEEEMARFVAQTFEELGGRRLCLVCAHGESSSLAAASLVDLGIDAGDLIGGYEGWLESGLPTE